MKSVAGLVLAAVVVAAVPMPGSAHHSFSAYNATAENAVTGVVKAIQWSNPHVWIWLDVPNDKGKTDTYAFEGMSPTYLERRNWTRTTLKAGDKITVSYNPMKDGANGGLFRNGRMENGKVLSMTSGTRE